jgi:hypothetical protein
LKAQGVSNYFAPYLPLKGYYLILIQPDQDVSLAGGKQSAVADLPALNLLSGVNLQGRLRVMSNYFGYTCRLLNFHFWLNF